MKRLAMRAVLAAGTVLGGSVAASAAVEQYDFTATPFQAFGTLDGTGFTVSFTPGDGSLTFNGGGDAPGAVDGTIFDLAGEGDGLGVNDDEVTDFDIGGESITLTFDNTVTLTGLAFLDLFLASENDPNPERAFVSVDGAPTTSFEGMMVVGDPNNGGFGTGFAEYGSLSLTGREFTFTAGNANDNVGQGDFALAAIQGETTPVIPLPASVLLLGGALGGFGFLRRRK